MADIATFLNKIRTAIYGEEVRSSIADAIEAVNKEGSSGGGGSGGTEPSYAELGRTIIYSDPSTLAYTALWKRSGIAFLELYQLPISIEPSTNSTFVIPSTSQYFPGLTGEVSFSDVPIYASATVAYQSGSITGYEERPTPVYAYLTIKPNAIELMVTAHHAFTGSTSKLTGFLAFPDPTAQTISSAWTQVYESPGDHHVTGDGIEYYDDGRTIYMHGHGNGFVFTNSGVSALLEILLTDRDIWFPVVIDNQYAAAGFMIRQGPYNRTVFGINATGISDGQHSVYFNFSYPKPAGFGAVEAGT